MKKILVTGAAGFIGMHTTEFLLARGDAVVGLDNLNSYYDPSLKEARLAKIRSHVNAELFEFVKADLADSEAMKALFSGHDFDGVIHLAAQAGVR
jgi:UDP-glucuronate 4-epimerase